MKHRRSFLIAFGLTLISLAATRTRAQVNTPELYLRQRAVTRAQRLNIGLPAFSYAAADQFATAKQLRAQTPPGMKLNVFPDVSFTINFDHVETHRDDTVTWYGRVDGSPYGQATFVLSGNRLIGSVTRGDGKVYEIRTAEDGTQWGLEIDQSKFPDETEPQEPERDSVQTPAAVAADAATYSDDGSIIDVLVLYTPAARLAVGGTTVIQQLIQLGISETNQGYANSGVIQRIRLVNSQEISYVESPAISTDLTRLRNAGDSYLDDAQTLRDTYGADLVSLWVNTSEATCGVGYLLSNPNLSASSLAVNAYTVAEQDCATGNYTFGHEMGHNMGANHAKDDLNSDGSAPLGAYSYSNGYKQPSGTNRFRTIMAYDGSCGCPRTNYWSNPNVNYNGSPTGVDPNSPQSAANYLTLNNTRTLVANFRTSVGNPPPGGADTTGPLLTITSHTNNQIVYTGTITVSGTATDSGLGNSGISSVTVNGVRASGDTASGSGTANWSRPVTLSGGANIIAVVVKDNSAGQNSTTSTITINFSTAQTASPTSSTYHVFPQFSDGVLSDGSFYRTTLMTTNPSTTATASCTFRLYGLTVSGNSLYSLSFPPGGWAILPVNSAQPLKSGYATLQCSSAVEGQLLYSYYSASGAKISEATVFSSPPGSEVQVVADHREGARLGLAISNDSDSSRTYAITAYNAGGNPIGSSSKTLAARSNFSAFVDELIPLPADYYGQVHVSSANGTASLIGLRYTGTVFTTIPEVIRSSVASTANTYHIFPQFGDGRLSDGSYYRTTVLIANSSSSSGNCTLRLYGLSVNGYNVFNYGTFSPGTWTVTTDINSTQSFKSGYATLRCDMAAEAQLLYSYYSPAGTKLSEATVFSSPASGAVQVLADNREGSRLAVAIANDTSQSANYTITAYDSAGAQVATSTRGLAGHSNLAAFLDELVSIPANHYGQVYVSGGSSSVIGLRFTGSAFTTIPQTNR